jgi:hypothetical protein
VNGRFGFVVEGGIGEFVVDLNFIGGFFPALSIEPVVGFIVQLVE